MHMKSSRVDSNHRSSACKAVALAAEPRDAKAETEGIEPPTLAGSRFQDGFLDQPGSLQTAAVGIEPTPTASKAVMLTFTLRRNEQAPAESNGVRLVQSQSCDHYTRSQYGRSESN